MKEAGAPDMRVHHSVTIMPSIRRATADDAEACHGVMWTADGPRSAKRHSPGRLGCRMVRRRAKACSAFSPVGPPNGGSLNRIHASLATAVRSNARAFSSLPSSSLLPMTQAKGVGRVLLKRAFPSRRIQIRSIIATTDERALSRYYARGHGATVPYPGLKWSAPTRTGKARSDARARLGLTSPRTPGGARNRARDPGVGARRGRDSLAARRSRGVPLRARRTQLASPSSESAARARSPL